VLGGNGLTVEGGSMGTQLGIQALGVIATMAWTAVFTFVIVKVTSRLTSGLRVDEEDELVGLDLATHGERGYDM
jgi:Amt family ammonium transporter